MRSTEFVTRYSAGFLEGCATRRKALLVVCIVGKGTSRWRRCQNSFLVVFFFLVAPLRTCPLIIHFYILHKKMLPFRKATLSLLTLSTLLSSHAFSFVLFFVGLSSGSEWNQVRALRFSDVSLLGWLAITASLAGHGRAFVSRRSL